MYFNRKYPSGSKKKKLKTKLLQEPSKLLYYLFWAIDIDIPPPSKKTRMLFEPRLLGVT